MSVTQEQREKNNVQTLILTSAVFGIICAYIFGYVGTIMSEDSVEIGNAFSIFMDNWSEGSFFYFPNGGGIVGILLGVFVGVFIYFISKLDYDRHKSYSLNEVAGTGGFMSEKELKDYTVKFVEKEEGTDQPYYNIILSKRMKRPIHLKEAGLKGNNNVLIVGAAGTGKSFNYIKPNIMQMSSSYIITDPSGEMIYAMGNMLKEHGYNVLIFNIQDMAHSNTYNPLLYVRDEAGVMMLVECFISNTTREGSKDEAFFVNAEKLLYTACIFYLKDFCNDESKKNFSTIVNMINMSSVDENNADKKSPLDKLFEPLPDDSLAAKFYKAFKQAAGKTLKSIIISCMTRLQPFMVPQVVNLTKTDELHLEKMGEEKTALFIITPQADKTYSFLASMLYSQAFETWYYMGEKRKQECGDERLPVPIMALMDEFANIGTVPEFPSKLSTMRKYNISATVVLQDLAQIKAMYKDDYPTLIANCSTHIYLGSTEQETLKFFSESLGKMTVTSKSRGMSDGKNKSASQNYQQTAREVMTSDELQRLPDDECVVYTQSYRALRDKKFKCSDHVRWNWSADSGKTPGFIYKKMPVYDNSIVKTHSIVRAMSEAARIRESEMISEQTKLSEIRLESSIKEETDRIVIPESENEEALEGIMEECMEQLSKFQSNPNNTDFPVFAVKNVPPKELPKLGVRLSQMWRLDRIIIKTSLFADQKLAYLIGIDMKHDGLLEAMDNRYAKEYELKDYRYKQYADVTVSEKSYKKYLDETIRRYTLQSVTGEQERCQESEEDKRKRPRRNSGGSNISLSEPGKEKSLSANLKESLKEKEQIDIELENENALAQESYDLDGLEELENDNPMDGLV